jgi:hypothetical protein
VGHQFSDPNPERSPALGRDSRPLAWVAKESADAVKYSAPLQPGAHLAVEHRPVDDSLATLHLAAAEPLVVPEAHQSAEVPRAAAAQLELSLEMLAQSKLPDAVAHSVQRLEPQALPALLQELVSLQVHSALQQVPQLLALPPKEPESLPQELEQVPRVSPQPALESQ